MCKVQLIVFTIALCCIAASIARPTEDVDSRRISKHARTSTRKRHADLSITNQLSKSYQEFKRMILLNNLVGSLESGRNYSVEANDTAFGAEVFPDKDAIPDQKDISADLLSRLNGKTVDDKLRVRVVDQRPVTVPRHLDEFIRVADNLRQQAAATRTCLDLQKTLLKIPSIRIRVRCRTQAHKRSVPVTRSLYKPQLHHIHHPYRHRPARRLHRPINNGYRYPGTRRHNQWRTQG